MLMDFMRRNTKKFLITIIAFIVPAFVIWGAFPASGGRGTDTILEVGKQKVSMDAFQQYYYQLREMARMNIGDNFNAEIEKLLNLKQQALDGIIQEILFEKEAERLDIRVSDQEVQDSLKQNPAFFTDGRFDAAKWNAAINDPRINWPAFIQQERESLRNRKLLNIIQAGARVTDDEIQEEYQRQNEKVTVEFVLFSAADFMNEIKLSEEDLAAYYEQHKEEYTEPAMVKLHYGMLEKEPSPLDFSDVEAYARNILKTARQDADFAALAEKYSDDPAARTNGGDLGFFGKGDPRRKDVEEAAFSLAPGEVSDLIKADDGFHIVKVEEVKGSGEQKEVRARDIFFAVTPSDDTLLSLEEKAGNLSHAARQSSLKEAASAAGIDVSETPLFQVNSPFIPSLGPVREVADIVPGLEQGTTSSAIETADAYYVVQVVERQPERIPGLAEVKVRVETEARAERALEAAKKKAESVIQEVNEKGAALAEAAPNAQEALPFTRRGYPPELPRVEEFVDVVFALQEGEAAGPFADAHTAFVVQLKEKIAPDSAGLEMQKETIRQRILAQRKQEIFEEYYENLKQQAGVKINEELFRTI